MGVKFSRGGDRIFREIKKHLITVSQYKKQLL